MTTVWIYVDVSKQVGDLDHLKVFIDEATANTWLAKNDWHSRDQDIVLAALMKRL
jgi:hypothetical protein